MSILESKYALSVKKLLDEVISRIDMYAQDYKITEFSSKLSFNDTSANPDLNVIRDNGETLSIDYVLDVTINGSNTSTYTAKIPVAYNKVFILDGKVKINLNYLTTNRSCGLYKESIWLSPDYSIIKVGDDWQLVERVLDDNNSIVTNPIDSISTENLDKMVVPKLMATLGIDEPFDTIDKSWIDKYMPNYDLIAIRDNVINKTIISTSDLLVTSIKENKHNLVRDLRYFYYKNGSISSATIEKYFKKFFNKQLDNDLAVSIPTNLNALTYETLGNKIILSKGDDNQVSFSRIDDSLLDFIDPIITPDNGNVNRINEHTSIVKITDDGVRVKCLDKSFNEVYVDFEDYLTYRVLKSDYVDYDSKKVSDGTLKVKYLGKEVESDQYDYIEMPPDARLSKSVQMIPMINHSDTVRTSMGSRMMNQSIEVVGCELPLVATGYETLDSSLIKKSPAVGTVVEVDNKHVLIQTDEVDDDGNNITVEIPRPDSMKSLNKTSMSFISRVKVGQRVQKNSVVYTTRSLDEEGNILNGVNCRVAMMNAAKPIKMPTGRWLDTPISTYEDALVISDTAASKFSHISVRDIDFIVYPEYRINEILLPSDSVVSSLDTLINYEAKLNKLTKNVNIAKKELLKMGDDYFYRPVKFDMPKNIDSAYLVDVKYIHGGANSTEENTLYWTEHRIALSKPVEQLPINYGYNLINKSDINYDKEAAYVIRFRLVVLNKLQPGDKITNRYGSKGVVSGIIPDDRMPFTVDNNGTKVPIEVIMNPAAMISRKNLSQEMEVYLANISKEVKRRCLDMFNNNEPIDNIRKLLKKYQFNNYATMDEESLVDVITDPTSFLQVITGCYSKYNIKEILDIYEELGIQEGDVLYDGWTGRKINKRVICGDMYLVKLYHLATQKAQVTIDKATKDTLVLGSGKESRFGLKFGTMEHDALIANNLRKYVEYTNKNDTTKAGWLLASAIATGFGFSPDNNGTSDYEEEEEVE